MKKLRNILIVIFIIMSIFIARLIYITKIKITDIAEFVNKKNNYKIIFQEVGEPAFPFGDTKIKVTLVSSNNNKIKSFEDYFSNDGASIRKENIKVNWYDDYVEITLTGGEQKDEIYELKYKQ